MVWKDAQVQRVNAVFLEVVKAPARQVPPGYPETKDSVGTPDPLDILV